MSEQLKIMDFEKVEINTVEDLNSVASIVEDIDPVRALLFSIRICSGREYLAG